MTKELGLLNFICIVAVIGFLVMIVVTALTAGDLLTTDTLFIITVCLVMAVMFAASPLLYLRSEGKLPIPFVKKPAAPIAASASGTSIAAPKAPMLDAKGRAMPADVRAIVSKLGPAEVKES